MEFDVCIIGGGSAGIGAAYRAAEAGADTVLVEKFQRLGGTAANAWVNNWEPSAGSSGLAKTLWQVMLPFHPYPPKHAYEATLKAAPRDIRRSTAWPVFGYLRAVDLLFKPLKNLRVLVDTDFVGITSDGRRVGDIVLCRDGQQFTISASVVIDASSDACVCRAAGCETRLGLDARSDFNEPHAPDEAVRQLNAMSLMYRVRYEGREVPFDLPDDVEPGSCEGNCFKYECPAGTWYLNRTAMIPDGIRWIDDDRNVVLADARRKVLASFHYMRRTDDYFRKCRFDQVAPLMGVRETYRTVCEYTLTEHDLLTGYDRQQHTDMIAMSDHPIDVHGTPPFHKWLETPYGIPYRCLVPKDFENLLVAGRCAGFSHIAGASCRLSRNMMALGEAAGLASAIMADKNLPAMDVPVEQLQQTLTIDDRADFVSDL